MGVPSWVDSDLPDEEKLRLFEQDMKHSLWAVLAGLVLGVLFIVISFIFDWK
jgi:hypothetical protein